MKTKLEGLGLQPDVEIAEEPRVPPRNFPGAELRSPGLFSALDRQGEVTQPDQPSSVAPVQIQTLPQRGNHITLGHERGPARMQGYDYRRKALQSYFSSTSALG